MKIKLEVACCNYISCKNAALAGADRIELFESMNDGGCTPSFGMIQFVKEKIDLPVYVMIRPRGGHFIYDADEMAIMKKDIAMCKQLDVDGIVFGILDQNGKVNKEHCQELLNVWQKPSVTFHRAIDRSIDFFEAAETIIDLGFERILTSGGARNVDDGKENIKKLQQAFGNKIAVLPGAGITPSNAKSIVEYCGVQEIHATAKGTLAVESANGIFTDSYSLSELEIISELLHSL